MFESEDFDLDEDFLKDIGEKEQEYYSQKIEPETTQLTKRRKIESVQPDFLSDISFDEEPDFARIGTKTVDPAPETIRNGESSSAKKFIGAINDKAVEHGVSSGRKIANDTGYSVLRSNKATEKAKTLRRTLALEILRRGGSDFDEEKRKNEHVQRSDANDGKDLRVRDEQTPRKTLLETFKKPAARTPEADRSHKSRFLPKENHAHGQRTTTLVRKFPGPAGLLPDCPEPRLDDPTFLVRVDHEIVATGETENANELSEYFSQNTERLFRSGAWGLMLQDLPCNFLRGHEIATIKKIARNNSRIPFLAGVVQRIDHSTENPRVLLKDRTDEIEGTMHRDIPLTHPNVLEPGVVVLLRNPGILGFQASPSFPSLQFHVMIAPRNLAAVYSEKSRVLASSWLNSFIGKSGDGNETERSKGENFAERMENPRKSGIIEDELDVKIDLNDFGNENDEGTFDVEDLEVSPAAPSTDRACSVSTEDSRSKEIKRKISPGTSTPAVKIPKNISPKQTSSERKNEETSEAIEVKPKKMESVRSRLAQFRSEDDLSARESNERPNDPEQNPNETKSPEISPRDERESRSMGFGEDLLDSDNDTEDELLSQLDVDSIVTSYNSI